MRKLQGDIVFMGYQDARLPEKSRREQMEYFKKVAEKLMELRRSGHLPTIEPAGNTGTLVQRGIKFGRKGERCTATNAEILDRAQLLDIRTWSKGEKLGFANLHQLQGAISEFFSFLKGNPLNLGLSHQKRV